MAAFAVFILCAAASPHPAALFSAMLTHEAAHIICAAVLRLGVPHLEAGRTGIRIVYRNGGADPKKRLLLCLSGPAVGALSALIFSRFYFFAVYSAGFSIINLLPLPGFDGGGALSALLEMLFLPDTASRIERVVFAVCAAVLCAASAAVQLKYGANLSLAVLCCACVVAALCGSA